MNKEDQKIAIEQTGAVEILENMDGDRDLYDLASKLTNRVIQPGGKNK